MTDKKDARIDSLCELVNGTRDKVSLAGFLGRLRPHVDNHDWRITLDSFAELAEGAKDSLVSLTQQRDSLQAEVVQEREEAIHQRDRAEQAEAQRDALKAAQSGERPTDTGRGGTEFAPVFTVEITLRPVAIGQVLVAVTRNSDGRQVGAGPVSGDTMDQLMSALTLRLIEFDKDRQQRLSPSRKANRWT